MSRTRGAASRSAASEPATLAPSWVAWIAENALRGASSDDLIEGLQRGGLPRERAEMEVATVLASPVLAGARRLVERSAAVEQVARLRRELDPEPLAVVEHLDEETLHHRFWTANRPVVLRGAARDWPAGRWTPEALAERFPEVEVDVLVGRSRSARWWLGRDAITRRMPLARFARLCLEGEGDDVYADGRTELLAQPGLEALRGELGLLPGLVGDGFPRLWMGPRGTVTPLHHDQSTGWLVQLCGRKVVRMASPLEVALTSTIDGVYNTVDPRQPQEGELAEVRWHTLALGPGDALLIPVGWWHHVESLEPSISVSMGGFRWPNVHRWYTPGRR